MNREYNHFTVLQLSKKEALKKYSLAKNSKCLSPKWKVTLNDYNHLLFRGKLNYISSSGNYPSGNRFSGMKILQSSGTIMLRYISYHPSAHSTSSSFGTPCIIFRRLLHLLPSICLISSFSMPRVILRRILHPFSSVRLVSSFGVFYIIFLRYASYYPSAPFSL